IMQAYEQGGHAYHATMPTDALRTFHGVMLETIGLGLEHTKARQQDLGERVRKLLTARGFKSVAAPGFQAPGVVVSYTDDPHIKNGSRFAGAGLQIAAGVPLRCHEPEGFQTFRLGLFGLDKLTNVDRTVATLESALDQMGAGPVASPSTSISAQ
ncbi:MAG: alanine--glyoxylate aminotransferase family protein, partial [Gemmatimonadetes bacterium]|nr:alanine--glyoxylate aminotransferase family protein [Gemmatimonadota bacterium]